MATEKQLADAQFVAEKLRDHGFRCRARAQIEAGAVDIFAPRSGGYGLTKCDYTQAEREVLTRLGVPSQLIAPIDGTIPAYIVGRIAATMRHNS